MKTEFIASFPSGTGELAHELWRIIANLHLNWKNYRALFGTSPERIEVLNWAASSFFRLLDGILRHNVMLAIARLTDPAKSRGHDNTSIEKLIELLKPSADPEFLKVWNQKLAALKTYREPLRKIRNRLLAHDDLATSLRYHAEPLPGISRAYIEGALEQIRDLFGDIEEKFRGSRTHHEVVISHDDAESLIYVLENARKQEEQRKRDLRQKRSMKPE